MIETRFKDTEVGRIPVDWDVKAIKELTDIVTGATPSTTMPSYWKGGTIKWMSSGELNHKFIYDVEGRITQLGYDNTGTHMLPKYCVLIGLAGQGKTRGTAAYNFVEICTNQSIAAILPNNNVFDSMYLYYFVDSQYMYLRTLSAGDGGRGGLNKNILLHLDVVLPSISEQTRIATALSKIDALISELGKLIEKKRAIKQGTMQQLLTGKKRLKGFSEPWVEKTLGENILFLRTGLNPRVHFKLNTPDADCFYITVRELHGFDIITDEQTDKINHSAVERIDERSKLKIGDVLFSGTGTIGQTALVKETPKNWGIKEGIYAITPNCKSLDSLFLIYYLHTTKAISLFSSMSSGSTINSVPMAKLIELPILLPSLSEQSAIVSVLSSMDEEISALEAKRNKYIAIKQGMMQQLLTGKIRLID